ncbi:MAG TPA: FHA domain-containing protein [Luteimonas sp.]|nr:FHA domain-containing protein [Luteimonas sp.]
MHARLIAYPPNQAAIIRALEAGGALQIGRAGDSGLLIDHPSISRAHAELHTQGDAWTLRDLDSKNGSFVEGSRVAEAILDRPCWLRLGDVYCEFAPLSDAEVAAGESGLRARRAVATAHTARLDGLQRLDDLLDASLRGVLELAQCERGFILLGDGETFAVRASLALDPALLGAREFSGSVGAVRRALGERRSVVANDVGREAWLASRASVVAAGLSALVCLPLLDGEHALGAVYADRTRPGPAITTLDLELLEAFAERASLWIAARHASELLAGARDDEGQPQWSGIVAAHAHAREAGDTT